jgi:hypothetical protein
MNSQTLTAPNGTEITIEIDPGTPGEFPAYGTLLIDGERVGFLHQVYSTWFANYSDDGDYTGRGTTALEAARSLAKQIDR